MEKFGTMMMLGAVLMLAAPALCLPGGADAEADIETVADIWHPIESLVAPDPNASQRSEAADKKNVSDLNDEDDDGILTRSASVDALGNSGEVYDDDEDNSSQEARSSPWLTGDYYYDYEYPIDEEYDAINDTKPEENEEPQSSAVTRVKRHSLQLANGEIISASSLEKQTRGGFATLGHNGDQWQRPDRAQNERKRWQSVNVPTRQGEEKRRRIFSSPLVSGSEQPARIVIRQRLQPGPAITSDSSQLGYRLQALLGGGAITASRGYSPSQQVSKQISATSYPVYARTNSKFSKDSTKSDVAKVLYTLAFLSKLQGQQRGSNALSTEFGTRYTSGSSASLNRPSQIPGASSGFTQLSAVRSQPAHATSSRLALVRLIQPLIRFVAVQKDHSPNHFQSFVQKLRSQESSAGYQVLIRQIQTENLKQHRFRQRLAFWRSLAQRLQRSQQEFPCGSK